MFGKRKAPLGAEIAICEGAFDESSVTFLEAAQRFIRRHCGHCGRLRDLTFALRYQAGQDRDRAPYYDSAGWTFVHLHLRTPSKAELIRSLTWRHAVHSSRRETLPCYRTFVSRAVAISLANVSPATACRTRRRYCRPPGNASCVKLKNARRQRAGNDRLDFAPAKKGQPADAVAAGCDFRRGAAAATSSRYELLIRRCDDTSLLSISQPEIPSSHRL